MFHLGSSPPARLNTTGLSFSFDTSSVEVVRRQTKMRLEREKLEERLLAASQPIAF